MLTIFQKATILSKAGFEVPACPAEDDAIDGTPGPACWWVSGEGNLWFNDGNGQR